MRHPSSQSGYVTLIGVLIMGAVGLAIASSILLLGVSGTKTSLALQQSKQANALAHACAEEALQQVRDASGFVGTNSMSLGQGTCSYTVQNTGGDARTVTASGTVGGAVRRVQILLNGMSPQINIISWQEVSSF